jgi:hypothetical protein
VANFAEPILAAIADRPPDVQEDFSEVGPNWYLEKVNCPNNGCSISDGSLSIAAFPVNGKDAWAQQPFPCCTGLKTFVMRVDVNTAKLYGENAAGIWYTDERRENGKFTATFEYYFELKSDRRWFSLPRFGSRENGHLPRSIPPQITYTLIASRTWFAVYLNDTPITYKKFNGGQYQATFSFGAWSDGNSGPARVEFDNFNIWNLDNIPNLP